VVLPFSDLHGLALVVVIGEIVFENNVMTSTGDSQQTSTPGIRLATPATSRYATGPPSVTHCEDWY
jgi:hypothetical protein